MNDEQLKNEADRMCMCLRDLPSIDDEPDYVSVEEKLARNYPPMHTFEELSEFLNKNGCNAFSTSMQDYAKAVSAALSVHIKGYDDGDSRIEALTKEFPCDRTADGYALFLAGVRKAPNGQIVEIDFGRTIRFLFNGIGVLACIGRSYMPDGFIYDRARCECLSPGGKNIVIEENRKSNLTRLTVEIINLLKYGMEGLPEAFPESYATKLMPCPNCGKRIARMKFVKDESGNAFRKLICVNCGHSVMAPSVATAKDEWEKEIENYTIDCSVTTANLIVNKDMIHFLRLVALYRYAVDHNIEKDAQVFGTMIDLLVLDVNRILVEKKKQEKEQKP